MSDLVDRLSDRLSVRNILLAGCMDRRYDYTVTSRLGCRSTVRKKLCAWSSTSNLVCRQAPMQESRQTPP